jgi:sugar lactone lactonase YvrE
MKCHQGWWARLRAATVAAAIAAVGAAGLLFATPSRGETFSVEKDDAGVAVKIDGKLFTKYLIKVGTKPILWPIIGPTGKEMTRAWPMREGNPDEKTDHVHQKSFWFTHGNVNGISFWDENKGHGDIVHREFVQVEGGAKPVIVTRNDWLGPDGKRVCRDERTLRFGADADARWIDFEAVVIASDGPVKFGDTKEGAFGVRVAGTVNVDKKMGGKIVNDTGKTDADAWGKPAAWVDYFGPVEGEQLGIAILNHPTSFRYPTHWHVRTYGLFAANPFGLHDFYNSKDKDGSHTLQPGESFTLKYRVIFHKGDQEKGRIADRFAEYAGGAAGAAKGAATGARAAASVRVAAAAPPPRPLAVVSVTAPTVAIQAVAIQAVAAQAVANPIVAPGAKLEWLYTREFPIRGGLSEGPAVAPDGSIYFTDIPLGEDGGMILRFDPVTKQTQAFSIDSGKANGLIFDSQGRLIACEGSDKGGRRVSRWNVKTGERETLADNIGGKKFNAPNDCCIDAKGRVYFTDPRYLGDEPRELEHRAVYRIDTDGKVSEFTREVSKPNGIAISPDGKTLYLADHDNGTDKIDPTGPKPKLGPMKIYAFPLDADGKVAGARKTLVDFGDQPGCDGMCVDAAGHIYITARSPKRPGVLVIDPTGKEVAFIATGPANQSSDGKQPLVGLPSNVEFGVGDEANVLYVTIDVSLYRIPLLQKGYHVQYAR